MAKKESTFLNMFLSLTIISALASLSLAFTYNITKGPIEKARLEKKLSAIKKVVPEFNNNPYEERYTIKDKDKNIVFYPAKKDGRLVGTAVSSFSKKGYNSKFFLMVGFLPDGVINRVEMLLHEETPGLGDKVSTDKFKNQYLNKNPKTFDIRVTKDGGKIDAITAATKSSRAYSDSISKAFELLSSPQSLRVKVIEGE
jgi:electron transport complex protein RnfG